MPAPSSLDSDIRSAKPHPKTLELSIWDPRDVNARIISNRPRTSIQPLEAKEYRVEGQFGFTGLRQTADVGDDLARCEELLRTRWRVWM